MCLGATQNFHGLAAARFFLGFAEGTVSPAFIIITSIWYKHREHPIQVAAWVSLSGVSQIVGALIMYGIGGADIKLENWPAVFLICGGLAHFALRSGFHRFNASQYHDRMVSDRASERNCNSQIGT